MKHAAPLLSFLLGMAAAAALAGDVAVIPPTPAVIPANDEEKARLADTAAKADAAKDDEALLKCLEEMLTRRNDAFVPTIRKALGSGEPAVQAAAVRAAASHELRDEEKRVRKILRAKTKEKIQGRVAAACIDYLGRLEIAGEEEAVLKDHLAPFLSDERRIKQSWGPEMVRASIYYFGRTKWKPAVPYIVDEVLREPVPRLPPSDPKNPPASYWEARHKIWHDAEGWARWSLKEITGQEFRSAREWTAWVDANKKMLEKGK